MDLMDAAREMLADAAYNASSVGLPVEDAILIIQAQYQIEGEDPDVEDDEDEETK